MKKIQGGLPGRRLVYNTEKIEESANSRMWNWESRHGAETCRLNFIHKTKFPLKFSSEVLTMAKEMECQTPKWPSLSTKYLFCLVIF